MTGLLCNWVAVPKDDIGGEGLRLPRGLVVGDELVFSGYVPSKSKKPIGDRAPLTPADFGLPALNAASSDFQEAADGRPASAISLLVHSQCPRCNLCVHRFM